MARPRKTDTPAREKILAAARDLFFHQGYHRTGINQLIEAAGVSKASFYDQFPSKEDLAVAYVRENAAQALRLIRDALASRQDPMERYLAFQEVMRAYLIETDFRGCAFSNIAREFPDLDSPVRREVIELEDRSRALLRETVQALFDSNPQAFANHRLSVDEVTDRYYLLIDGAINASANYHAAWPFAILEPAARDLVAR